MLGCSGAGLGLLAGLTGTGGGVFLSPLLLVRRWRPTRLAAAVSALVILLNSLAGLAGLTFSRPAALGAVLPHPAGLLLPVVLLAVVLSVAVIKLLRPCG